MQGARLAPGTLPQMLPFYKTDAMRGKEQIVSLLSTKYKTLRTLHDQPTSLLPQELVHSSVGVKPGAGSGHRLRGDESSVPAEPVLSGHHRRSQQVRVELRILKKVKGHV